METQVGKLTVSYRDALGKGAVTKLRATGKVPGVCYGANVDGRIQPLPVSVDVKALRAALDPVRKQNTILELTVEGSKGAKLSALVKEFQIDVIRRDIVHVDFLAIDPNKLVLAHVPLEFTGKPKGAIDGGQIRIVLRSLDVRAKPSDIPTNLVIDVSPLGIGDVIHVSSIALPAGVTVLTGRDLAVVTCAKPEEEKVEVAADGAVAGAPAAAGATPAAGAAAAPAAGGKAAAPAAGGKAAAPAAGAKAAAPAAKPAKK